MLALLFFANPLRAEDPVTINRNAIVQDLLHLAQRAQEYMRQVGSFGGLTADATGLAKLTNKRSTTNGTFSIQRAGNATSVALRAVGWAKGFDCTYGINITAYVFTDSVGILVSN
jgi:hypothetical protein